MSAASNSVRRLSRFLLPIRGQVALSALLGFLTVGASISLMATSAWLISKAGLQPGIETLGLAVVGVRAFGISRAVFRYLERLVSHQLTFKLLASIRVWFYEAIVPLAPARLSHYQSGDLLSRMVSDVESLQDFYIRTVSPLIVAVLTVVAMIVFFALFDPLVGVIGLVAMIVAGTGLPLFGWWRARKPGQALIKGRAQLNGMLVDHLQGMADSIIYGYDIQQTAALQRVNTQLKQQEQHLTRLDGLQVGVGLLATHLTALIVLCVAIPRVDSIYLATLALATVAAFEAITPLGSAAVHWGTTIGAVQRLEDIIDTTPPLTLQPPPPSPVISSADLHLSQVTFAYEKHAAPVLKDVSLSVTPGQKIAVVGASGAGKSTLANILLRFWDYQTGDIFLGGHDLRTLQPGDIYDTIAYMSQRTHLFNTTIRENIAIAHTNATENDVIAAAQRAHLHALVHRLPDGYDTVVGEHGAQLSGGERQRVALARVLLKDAPLIILDEPTANLDAITERAILRDLYSALDDQTLIMITHRLTMLEPFDTILVLHQGEIVERGQLETLLDQPDGYLKALWDAQTQQIAK